jgi:hypothetical protein
MTKIRPIGASRSPDIGVFKVADKVAVAICFFSFCAIRRLLYGSGIERVIEDPFSEQNPAQVVAAPMPTIR